MYEWTVACNVCGCTRAMGGFSTPQTGWTNSQVLASAEHNPGCKVPFQDPNTVQITSGVNGVDAEYWIGPNPDNTP